MPIYDMCVLYQKTPDKVVDVVKQVSFLFLIVNKCKHQKKER